MSRAEGTQPPSRRRRFCINCDNRHGCRTAEPLCLTIPRGTSEADLRGREFMERRGLLDCCLNCGHFKKCWSADAYRLALRRAVEGGGRNERVE